MSSLTIERSRIVKTPFRQFASLYWRLSATLLLLLAVLAVVYVYITAFTADMYFQEATQRLNAMVAPYIAREVHPFVDGKIDRGQTEPGRAWPEFLDLVSAVQDQNGRYNVAPT